LRPTQPFI